MDTVEQNSLYHNILTSELCFSYGAGPFQTCFLASLSSWPPVVEQEIDIWLKKKKKMEGIKCGQYFSFCLLLDRFFFFFFILLLALR